ncbi:hypothetical protein [Candidatus Chlorohelix sp.]|uniref:hypothetical protein n=1 Tax=Candidatus Chlorohelix sp. TaxID=3139201 RepID=UPI003057E9BA
MVFLFALTLLLGACGTLAATPETLPAATLATTPDPAKIDLRYPGATYFDAKVILPQGLLSVPLQGNNIVIFSSGDSVEKIAQFYREKFATAGLGTESNYTCKTETDCQELYPFSAFKDECVLDGRGSKTCYAIYQYEFVLVTANASTSEMNNFNIPDELRKLLKAGTTLVCYYGRSMTPPVISLAPVVTTAAALWTSTPAPQTTP